MALWCIVRHHPFQANLPHCKRVVTRLQIFNVYSQRCISRIYLLREIIAESGDDYLLEDYCPCPKRLLTTVILHWAGTWTRWPPEGSSSPTFLWFYVTYFLYLLQKCLIHLFLIWQSAVDPHHHIFIVIPLYFHPDTIKGSAVFFPFPVHPACSYMPCTCKYRTDLYVCPTDFLFRTISLLLKVFPHWNHLLYHADTKKVWGKLLFCTRIQLFIGAKPYPKKNQLHNWKSNVSSP